MTEFKGGIKGEGRRKGLIKAGIKCVLATMIFRSVCPQPGLPLAPVLFFSDLPQWIAPDVEDLAAGESWSKYPGFWMTLTSLHQVDSSVA